MNTTLRTYNSQQQGLTVYSQITDQQVVCSVANTWYDVYSAAQTTKPLNLVAYRFSLLDGDTRDAQVRILAAPFGTSLTTDNKVFPFTDGLDIEFGTLVTIKTNFFIPEMHAFKIQVKAVTILAAPVTINLDYASIISTELYKIPV